MRTHNVFESPCTRNFTVTAWTGRPGRCIGCRTMVLSSLSSGSKFRVSTFVLVPIVVSSSTVSLKMSVNMEQNIPVIVESLLPEQRRHINEHMAGRMGRGGDWKKSWLWWLSTNPVALTLVVIGNSRRFGTSTVPGTGS